MVIQREVLGVATASLPLISALPLTTHSAVVHGLRSKVRRGNYCLGGSTGALLKFSPGAVPTFSYSLLLFLKPLKFAKAKKMSLKKRTTKKQKRG